MNDLDDRADDYEKRLAAAGSTEDLIGGLVIGVERTKKLVKWLLISLVFDLALSIVLGGVAYFAWQNSGDIEEAAITSCEHTNDNSKAINGFLDLLIQFSSTSPSLTPEQREERVDEYTKQKIKLLKCEP